MTDKLKELVAKWRAEAARHRKIAKEHAREHAPKADDYDARADELEAILVEQAPAMEWDARAWLDKEFPSINSSVQEYVWSVFEREVAIRAFAAGRSSQPVETRDPAAK